MTTWASPTARRAGAGASMLAPSSPAFSRFAYGALPESGMVEARPHAPYTALAPRYKCPASESRYVSFWSSLLHALIRGMGFGLGEPALHHSSNTEHPLNKAALLIEDKDTALEVRTALECAGFQCEAYATMVPLLRALRRDDHVAIIVDASPATVDCAAVLGWRSNWLGTDVAVIALGPDDGQSVMRQLDLGVDDFVAKPVRGAELLARLRTVLRRHRPVEALQGLSIAGCSIDRAASAIVSTSSRVTLTARELALAQLLFENAGQLVTRARLARDVWGQNVELTSRSIEQHIYQLRRKIKQCAGEALTLRGVYGSGYRIDVAGTLSPASTMVPSAQRTPPQVVPQRRAGEVPRVLEGLSALTPARRASDIARQPIALAVA